MRRQCHATTNQNHKASVSLGRAGLLTSEAGEIVRHFAEQSLSCKQSIRMRHVAFALRTLSRSLCRIETLSRKPPQSATERSSTAVSR